MKEIKNERRIKKQTQKLLYRKSCDTFRNEDL